MMKHFILAIALSTLLAGVSSADCVYLTYPACKNRTNDPYLGTQLSFLGLYIEIPI